MLVAPQEVVDQFRGELDVAAATAQQAKQQEAEAERVHLEASSASDQADEKLHSLRTVAVAAVEACDDTDTHETLAALLAIKGKPEEEVEDYIGHLESICSTESLLPVAIVSGSSKFSSHQPSVTYGRIVPPHTQFLVNRDTTGRLDRSIVARVDDPRVLVGREGTPLQLDGFAARKQDGTSEDLESTVLELPLNPDQPFEDIRFAATSERINEIIEQAGADSVTLSETDQKIFRAFGIPAVVAYGNEAVAAVSERLVKNSDYSKLFIRRSLKGLGVSVEAVADAEPTEHTRSIIRDKLIKELTQVLKTREPHTRPEISSGLSRLAFLGSLQDSLEATPEFVLEGIVEELVEQDI